MHLAEGVLPLSQAIAWSALAAPTVFWSLREEQRTRRNTPSSSVIMAGATSLLFAGTLLPLPVPVVWRNQSYLPYAGARPGCRRPPHRVAHVLRALAAGGLLRSRRAHDAGGQHPDARTVGASDDRWALGFAPAARCRRGFSPRSRRWRRRPECIRGGRRGARRGVVRCDGACDDLRRGAARVCPCPDSLGGS